MTPQPASILVVDDTPANLSLLLDALSDAGHRILVAESGSSALQLLGHEQPDLILLDVVMPGLDGFATCERVKALRGCGDIPVLFMTALNEPTEKVRAFAAGAVDYIAKPVYPPEVLARVDAHLRIRSLQRSLEQKNAELAAEIEMRIEAENQLSVSLDRAVIVVTRDTRIHFSTHLATNLLYKYFSALPPSQLPEPLQRAVSERIARRTPETAAETLEIVRDSETLVVRFFSEPGRDDFQILFLEERNAPSPSVLMSLGLTAREAEVLYWIAQGKSNPDIATILSLGLRTVHKHVEHIFQKLGCETRAAAALTAVDILRSGK